MPAQTRKVASFFAGARFSRFLIAALVLLLPALAIAQGSAVSRVTGPINEGNLTTLRGNTHPLARTQNDQGIVADGQPIRRMMLLLQRSASQDAALKQLVDQQQSSASPNYHQWLTPQQIGQQFGPSDTDVQAVTDWLQSHGFQIARVNAAKTLIEFSGNAGQVRNAFHTEIHRYVANGEEHFANNSDPQIPTALAPVVAGTVSLNNFPKHAQSRQVGVFRKTQATGQVVPLFSFPNGCPSNSATGTTCNALGPGDFARIYNVQNLWASGIDGTGQTIAIVGDSEICTANTPSESKALCGGNDDPANFRSIFGLPAKSPNVILDGPDPGFNGDEIEGNLDVQWSGAVAKNATIDLVIAETTEATAGIDLAAEYIVDNNLAPVMSESFGACEAFLGNSGNQFYAALWEQAAAQGITVIVSTGDSGSASCDNPNTQSAASQFGDGVNGLASTPFNVAAGGTDFDVTATSYQSTYWGADATVGGVKQVSALSYIPETTWNDSCAQNFTGAVTGCSPPPNINSVNIVGGGGGQSNCASLNASNTRCTGSYPKPSWQTVATGSGLTSANDLSRDLPDISLFAADGLVSNSFYAICDANFSSGPCNATPGFVDIVGVGGTSSAAPTFAGMMALVNQQMTTLHATNSLIPTRQGNANYVLYSLFAKQTGLNLNCSSSASGGPNSTCTFNDVIKGNNSVTCVGTSPGCSNTASSATYGVLETENSSNAPTGTLAFNAGTGFDLATGLGSVNASNLVNNWGAALGLFTPTATTLCLSTTSTTVSTCVPGPINITHGTTVYVNISVSPSPGTWANTKPEDASLIGTLAGGSTSGVDHFTSNNYVISNTDIYPLSSGSISAATTNDLVGGSYSVIAHYAGDGTFGASDSTSPISVIVTPEGSTANVSVGTINPVTQSLAQVSSVPYGDINLIRVDVQGASSGQESASGTVTLTDGGVAIADPFGNKTSTFTLNTEGYLEDQTAFLAVGSHSFQAKYNGDPSYLASPISAAVAFTVTQAPTTTTVSSSANPVAANTNFTLIAFVDTQSATNPSGGSSGLAPTGTVTFFSGTTALGTVAVTSTLDSNQFVAAQATLTNVKLAATSSITATYNADANYTSSTSSALPITVTGGVTPSITLAPAANAVTVNISAPGQSNGTTITVNGSNGFAGVVTLSYSVSPSNLSDPPTCTFTTNPLTLSATITSAQSTINCGTTAVSSLVAPLIRTNPNRWLLTGEIASAIACMLLLFLANSKQRGLVTLAVLLFTVIAVATSCGGGGGSSSGSTGNPGTTVGAYTVTVTATPPTGSGASTQTTTITFNVQ